MSFPARVYTEKEVRQAKALIDKGYRHRLRITGTTRFRQKVKQAVALLKTAGYYDFFRTYIAKIMEIDGLTQLRQSEAALWLNKYAVKNTVDAASLFVQKASLMKEYLEGTLYYGGQAEKLSGEKRVKFLEELKLKTKEKSVAKECERLVQMWTDSSLIY